MSLYKRGAVWWSRIEWQGKPYVRSTKSTNKNAARSIDAAWKLELALGQVGIYKSPTVREFNDRFINYLATKVSKRTWRFYIDAWAPVERLMGNVKMSQIDGPTVEQFITARMKETYARGEKGIARSVGVTSINHSIQAIRRACHLAAEWKLISRAPRLKMLKGAREREYVITEADLARFIELADSPELDTAQPFKARRFHSEMKDVLPFLVDTGLRAGELCRLDWSDVDLERGTVQVRIGKTKTSKRRVPLTKRARAILERLPRSPITPAVFHRSGQRITVTWASHQFTAMRRRLQLPDGCVLHSTRHTAASNLGRAGASAFEIMRILGHSNIEQASKYTHTDEDTLQRAIERLNPANAT